MLGVRSCVASNWILAQNLMKRVRFGGCRRRRRRLQLPAVQIPGLLCFLRITACQPFRCSSPTGVVPGRWWCFERNCTINQFGFEKFAVWVWESANLFVFFSTKQASNRKFCGFPSYQQLSFTRTLVFSSQSLQIQEPQFADFVSCITVTSLNFTIQ